jgi:hypothetical protein
VAVSDRPAPGAHRYQLAARSGRADFFGAVNVEFRGMPSGPRQELGGESDEVRDGTTSKLTLSKNPTAQLRGILRENGSPLAGARISFVEGQGTEGEDPQQQIVSALSASFGGGAGGSRRARSGEDGGYQLKELVAGQHRLRITHQSRALATTVAVSLRNGDNVFDIELASLALRGTVRDAEGQPVAGAKVRVQEVRGDGNGADRIGRLAGSMIPGMDLGTLMGGGPPVRTGADGRFELRGVPAGVRLQVSASASGFADGVSAEVELTAGSSRDGIDVVLGQAGRITISAPNAGPFTPVRAVFLGADGEPDPSVTEAMQMMTRNGVTLEGLRPGRWRVSLVTGADGAGGESRTVEVVAGATAKVAF